MSFYGVTDLWTYVIGAFGIILLPGPNSLYVLSVATARGVRAGYQGAFGVFLGDTILLLLTALGAASLLAAQNADAAQQVADLAAGDNRVGILATLAVPAVSS